MSKHNVFVRVDEQNRITKINSSAFLPDTTGWVQIDEGDGDRYAHAQGNYLPGPLMAERGRYRYKLVDGAVVERTPEELAVDALPTPVPSDAERLDTLESLIVDTQYQLALAQLGLEGEV